MTGDSEDLPGDALVEDGSIDLLELPSLSDWFDPFIRQFLRDALRCGGEGRMMRTGTAIEAVYLYHPVENEATVFARDPRWTRTVRAARPTRALYSDFDLDGSAEPYSIYAGAPRNEPLLGLRHPIRVGGSGDREALLDLLRSVYDRVDPRWLDSRSSSAETCLVAEGSGELVGAAWATVRGSRARLHSLTVRLPYRNCGVGTDLFEARAAWLRTLGVDSLVSEIAESNRPSRAIAERAGLRVVGRMFRIPAVGSGP